MNYSEIKEVITVANEYNVNVRELYDNVINDENDFEIDNYRFIKESEALDIAVSQYKDDNYILGCFNADFIEDNTNLSYNVIKALQKAEAFEELGELINDCDLDSFIEEYSRLDGWGNVFGSYNGNNDEININGEEYIVFRTN